MNAGVGARGGGGLAVQTAAGVVLAITSMILMEALI